MCIGRFVKLNDLTETEKYIKIKSPADVGLFLNLEKLACAR